MKRLWIFLLALATVAPTFAALPPVPREALKTLQISRGKPCRKGAVFMDGKYIVPPYVVKRYGTAIMINDVQVTGPLVPWEDFLKTQSSLQVVRTPEPETPVPAPPPPAEKKPAEDDDPLADLFDDEPAPPPAPKPPEPKRPPAPAKPAVTTTYALEGRFVPNEASRALLDRINRYRTDVNARLMRGGFIFFGTNYARVSGEARETRRLIETLPTLMRNAESPAQFNAEMRRAGFHYLTEPITRDLYRHKYLYPQIEMRARQTDFE